MGKKLKITLIFNYFRIKTKLNAEKEKNKMNEKKNIGLIKALKDKDVLRRMAAAMTFGDVGDSSDVEPLIKALNDDHIPGVRQVVAEALGKIRDPRAVGPLTKALLDENKKVREAAVEALKKIRK